MEYENFTCFAFSVIFLNPVVSFSKSLSLINENSGLTGGSLGSAIGFDPSFGAPGLVFDVFKDFKINAVSYGVSAGPNSSVGPETQIKSTVNILQQTDSTFNEVSSVTMNAELSGDKFTFNGAAFEWVDVPLSFDFVSGEAYSVQLPFWDFSFIGEGFTFFFIYNAFPISGGPAFAVESVGSVTSATLLGNAQSSPLVTPKHPRGRGLVSVSG